MDEILEKEDANLKKEDEIFCKYCGKIIRKAAVICPMCGIQLKELKTSAPIVNLSQTVNTQVIIPQSQLRAEPKSKIVAIILAIFLGFWSYLYTYSYDSRKFWLTIIVNIIAMPFILVSVIRGNSGTLIFLYIFQGFFYIWPILTFLIRPTYVFKNYPNY